MSRQQHIIERLRRLSPARLALLRARLDSVRGTPRQDERLLLSAFITSPATPGAERELLPAQLAEALRACLPDYMLPASITVLDSLPLLPNGKIDGAALAAIRQPAQRAAPAASPAAPQRHEQQLITIWSTVLQSDFIDIGDNFFELGGDSILSIQVVSQAHQAGLPMTASDLFEHPTIGQLADCLRAREAAGNPPAEPAAADHRDDPADFADAGLDQADLDDFLDGLP